MTGLLAPTTAEPLGFAGDIDARDARFFDIRQTLISQYANSPVIIELVDRLGAAFDRQVDADAFYKLVWNVETAKGFGLDIWGRIVGVRRALYIADGDYLGFAEATDAQNFDAGIFYGGARLTANYALSDEAYRRVILAKAALNITDGSVASINAILRALFPNSGNPHVRDNGNMTMTFVFGERLSRVDHAIITQSGVVPRPVGVSFTVEQP